MYKYSVTSDMTCRKLFC